jgi:hypothetical protein
LIAPPSLCFRWAGRDFMQEGIQEWWQGGAAEQLNVTSLILPLSCLSLFSFSFFCLPGFHFCSSTLHLSGDGLICVAFFTYLHTCPWESYSGWCLRCVDKLWFLL